MERMNDIWLPWLRIVGCPEHPATLQTASWIMAGVSDDHSRDFPFVSFMMRYWKMVIALRVFDKNLIPCDIGLNDTPTYISYSGCSVYTELLDSEEVEGMEGCVSPGRFIYAPCDTKSGEKEKYKMMRAYDFITRAYPICKQVFERNIPLLRSMGLDPDNAKEGPASFRMENDNMIAIVEPAWFGYQSRQGMVWSYSEPVTGYCAYLTGDVRYVDQNGCQRFIWSKPCLLSFSGWTPYAGHLDFKKIAVLPTEIMDIV